MSSYLQLKKRAFMSIVNGVKGFVRTVSGVPPISLEDCVDSDSMIDWKLYGNSVQDGTPTPETPVEVQSLGEKTVNLFDKDNANVFGGYITGNSLVAYSTVLGNNRITCIECKPNTTYTISRQVLSKRFAVASGIYAPDKDITFTKSILNYNALNIQIATDSEDAYLYVWFYNGSVDTEFTYDEIINGLQIQEGTTATPYEPYNKYKIPVTARGKNLFDKSSDKINGFATKTLDSDGNIVIDGGSGTGNYISANFVIPNWECLIGKTLTISGSWIVSDLNKGAIRIQYNRNGSAVGTVFGILNNSGEVKTTSEITAPSQDGDVLCVYLYANTNGTMSQNATVTYTNIQLETGTTATEYEPYHAPIQTTLYLDEPLRKVGDYADYVDFGKGEVIRNTAEITFDGSEAWYKTDKFIYLSVRNMQSSAKGFSTHIVFSTLTGATADIYFYATAKVLRMYQSSENPHFSDIEAFKAFLTEQEEAGTPLKVTYILAEPTHTPISIPKLPTIKGTTIYEIGTCLNASYMEATYYSTVKGE